MPVKLVEETVKNFFFSKTQLCINRQSFTVVILGGMQPMLVVLLQTDQ